MRKIFWPTGDTFIFSPEKQGGVNLFGRISSVIAPSLVCINLDLPSPEILVKILFNFNLLIIHSTLHSIQIQKFTGEI